MPELFNGEDVDLSAIYRDSAAPKDPDPADVLYGQLGQSIKPPVTPKATTASGIGAPARGAGTNPNGQGRLIGPPTQIGGGATGRPAPAGSSVGNPSADSTALLARLKPLGITNLNSLRSKSDVQLRQLSQDVVTYELRQQAMNKYFKQNPDGSYDFTVGPDGRPTGLDATGKQAVPGTTAGAPAPKPAPATAPTVKPPAPKPAAKPAAKKASAPKRTTTKKKATTTKRRTTHRASAPLPKATKVTRPPAKTTTTYKPTVRPGLRPS